MESKKTTKKAASAIRRMIDAAKELAEIERQSKRRTRKAADRGSTDAK